MMYETRSLEFSNVSKIKKEFSHLESVACTNGSGFKGYLFFEDVTDSDKKKIQALEAKLH